MFVAWVIVGTGQESVEQRAERLVDCLIQADRFRLARDLQNNRRTFVPHRGTDWFRLWLGAGSGIGVGRTDMVSKSLGNKVALVTGASSGIGSAIALEYARRGADLVLAARRADRLDEIASQVRSLGQRALPVECDVTVDGDIERAVSEGINSLGSIDRVYANAGFGVHGPLEKLELEDYRRQFETNVFGVLRTVLASVEPLKASRGCLAMIGSVSGFVAMPGGSPYSMSKAAVHVLADALRSEFARHGVGVTLVVPGFIKSEIRRVDNRGVFRPEARDRIPDWLPMTADAAARKIVKAVESRRRVLVLTGHGRLAVLLQRHAPWLVAAAIGRLGGRVRRDRS